MGTRGRGPRRVHVVRKYSWLLILQKVGYRCTKDGERGSKRVGEGDEVDNIIGTHKCRMPLLSTLTSSLWRAFMAYTRDSIRFNVFRRGIRILREIRDLEIVDAKGRR